MSGTNGHAPLPPKLAALLEAIERLRGETLGFVSPLSDEALDARAPGGWSPAELVEHLLLAEASAGKVVRKVLRESGGSLPSYPADDTGIRIRQPLSFDGMEAPPVARPAGGMSRDGLLLRADEVRAATHDTIRMLAAVDPRAGEFPHHRFGSLNLYEWLAVVILEHERGHRGQLLASLPEGGRP